MKQRRVLSMQDLSCTGRCSLTVALPILSAAGLEVACLPTAVLSTHTGGFTGYTFRDLTSDIEPILDHWGTLIRGFDAIQTGYLARDQIPLAEEVISRFRGKDTLVLADPAMADGGRMYPGFDLEFARSMAGLVSMSDIAVPNLTEACFLLGEEYADNPTRERVEELLRKLSDLGPRHVLISGLRFRPGRVGVLSYSRESDSFDWFDTEDIQGYFHGSGDIFAAALLAGIERGLTLPLATRLAHDLVHLSIRYTLADEEEDTRFGLHFERALPDFSSELERMLKGEQTRSIFED